MRASDAEREAAAGVLRQHYTDGRLDAAEYNERIERCYAAKTMSELDALFTDLPRMDKRAAEPEAEPSPQGFRPPWRLAFVVPIIVAMIALAALTHGHFFFLLWPLFFFLLFRPFRWCGPGAERRRGAGTTRL